MGEIVEIEDIVGAEGIVEAEGFVGAEDIAEAEDLAGIEEMQPYAYWLDNVFGVGEKTASRLLEIWESPKAVFEAEEEQLAQYVGVARLRSLVESREKGLPEAGYAQLAHDGISFVPFYHPDYPKRLFNIPDRPFAVYVKGRLPEDDRPSVAVVGARQCSEYGKYVAGEFGGALASAGIQVVSGLARGIDGISQQAAVEQGGDTYAVLGCGVDLCYPRSNSGLYRDILHKGGILSSYPPQTEPRAQLFPPRNRIISGLADVLLVVEARQKSGTLITVDMALEQGKEVFVIPGRLTDRLSDGCNRLLKQGAGIALSPDDFIREVLHMRGEPEDSTALPSAGNGRKKNGKKESNVPSRLTDRERRVYDKLELSPRSLEEIRSAMKEKEEVSLREIMHILLKLVMYGLAEQISGSYYVRRDGEFGKK